jgi:hypothetical protein
MPGLGLDESLHVIRRRFFGFSDLPLMERLIELCLGSRLMKRQISYRMSMLFVLTIEARSPIAIIFRLNIDTQQHLGMLGAAVLRTPAEVDSGLDSCSRLR